MLERKRDRCARRGSRVRKRRAWRRTSAGLPGCSGSAGPSILILTPPRPVLASSPAAPTSRFGGIGEPGPIPASLATWSSRPLECDALENRSKTTNTEKDTARKPRTQKKTLKARPRRLFSKTGEEGAAVWWRGLGRDARTPGARRVLSGRPVWCGAGRSVALRGWARMQKGLNA